MKKLAIVGAGFAGLAAAWHLSQHFSITLFDASGIGGGASGIAAGLLHPYVGAHAKLSENGQEAMQETRELLDISSNALGKSVYQDKGMVRLALSEQQQADFFSCAQKYSDVEWQGPCLPHTYPGIFIRSALQVDCPEYLKGLFLACQKKGLKYIKQKIQNLEELDGFDKILLTTGAEALLCPKVPISQVKGQILRMKWPKSLIKPKIPVNSKAYLIQEENDICLLGATFEHTYDSPLPDVEKAKQELLPKIAPIYPELTEVLECRAALRASTPSRKPIISSINSKTWVYTGLGSKGLLYHAFYAKKLKDYIL